MRTITFDKALDTVEKLTPDQQEELAEIVLKRVVERRRKAIANSGRETMQAVKEGKAKRGTIEDLRKDLQK